MAEQKHMLVVESLSSSMMNLEVQFWVKERALMSKGYNKQSGANQ